MTKLKTFEQYVLSRAEEIEQDVVDAGTPDIKDVEEIDKDKEVAESHHDGNLLDWFNGLTDEDLKSEKSFLALGKSAGWDKKDLENIMADAEQGDESNVQWAKDIVVEGEAPAKEVEDVEAEAPAKEVESEETESEEAKTKIVSEMLQDVFESCKNEAKVYEDDAHDEHTIESYMKENASLLAAFSAKTLKEMKEEYAVEAYEAACNEMVDAFSKKMNEMKESDGVPDASEIE